MMKRLQVVLFGTKQLEKLGEGNPFEIKTGSEVIKPTPLARNLGFRMEAQLGLKCITKVCGTAYSTLKNIARVWNLSIPESEKIIIQGLATSKLDYCNGLLLGASACHMNKLQIVQKCVVV